ncbi:CDP-glucose 4,6-dehydratase [Paraflavisolibacter sp. H34]|uniref:CDP-glucose 4,6-dehydratase n=1 Tax=Huijunlia imazamoxiresistens TaxID=3127457 RepID=UPI003017A76B
MENLVSTTQLQRFFRNKKVFITGHTGFKGSWLMALLQEMGARIKGYALPPEQEGGLFDFLRKEEKTESVLADIRDRERLRSEIVSFEPDFIFHLAAQPLVRRSYEIPAETFDVNVVGTANLLEAMRSLQHKCTAVIITTDKVYFNKEQDILYKEEDRLGGYDPYSASKACTELVVDSFRNSFFNPAEYHIHQKAIASARAGNVIGGGDWSKDRLVPDIVRSLQQQRTIEVRNPRAVRPWQHVLEPLCGYLLLGALLENTPAAFSDAYNFGPRPEDHLTVEDLVKTAIENWQGGAWKDTSDPGQPHEATLLKLDISKAEKALNWHPRLNAKQSIAWTINWYRQPAGQLSDYTFRQIREYLAL